MLKFNTQFFVILFISGMVLSLLPTLGIPVTPPVLLTLWAGAIRAGLMYVISFVLFILAIGYLLGRW